MSLAFITFLDKGEVTFHYCDPVIPFTEYFVSEGFSIDLTTPGSFVDFRDEYGGFVLS